MDQINDICILVKKKKKENHSSKEKELLGGPKFSPDDYYN